MIVWLPFDLFLALKITPVVETAVYADMFLCFMFQVVMKQNAVIEHLKQKKTMTPAEREENQRFVSTSAYCMDKDVGIIFSQR